MRHRAPDLLRQRNAALCIAVAIAAALALATGAAAKPPSWDKRIDGKGRFKVLSAFDGGAVLDKETGLVWEQSSNSTSTSWSTAVRLCLRRVIGARGGWHLPRFEELATIIDPESGAMPAAHPFDAPQAVYWTATTYPADDGPASSLVLLLDSRDGATIFGAKDASTDHRVWCVRGGVGVDDQ